MATALRIKTYPEILAGMFARIRGLLGNEVDLNRGSWLRTILEACALQDADQYNQIGRLLKLFAITQCKGDDLDQRFLELGADLYKPLRRKKAQTSIVKVTVGDGTVFASSSSAVDTLAGATTMTCATGEGANFAAAGSIIIERGTERQEEAIYTRAGDVFTFPTPLTFAHPAGASMVRVSTKARLAAGVLAGATVVTLEPGTGASFPASGSVIFERETVRRELQTFTRVNDTLTLGVALTFAHGIGTDVTLSTNGSDRSIAIGSQCYVPATDTNKQINFRTTEAGVLKDGDVTSGLINAESDDVGADTRIGSGQLVRWLAPPFANATVTNPSPASRGSNREEDDAYLARGLAFLQSLSRGTALAIETYTTGVTDETTNQEVVFAQVQEPVAPGMSLLYITDGSNTFALAQQILLGRDVVISVAEAGDKRGKLSNYAPFRKIATPATDRTPRLFKSVQRGEATSVGVNYLEDTTKAMVVNYYAGAYLKTDDNQFYEVVSNTAIRFTLAAGGAIPSLGSYAIVDFGTNPQVSSVTTAIGVDSLTDGLAAWAVDEHAGKYVKDSAGNVYTIASNTGTVLTLVADGNTPAAGAYTITAGPPEPLVPDTDYQFNETTGDLELSTALVANDCLVAASDGNPTVGAYTYSEGLAATVQRAVNGDPAFFDVFPGLKAVGTKVLVTAPTIISPNLVIRVVSAPGFSDVELSTRVKAVVVTYVNSLGIGANIVLSEIIRLVKELPGVADVQMISPTINPVVASGQLARIDEDNVTVV